MRHELERADRTEQAVAEAVLALCDLSPSPLAHDICELVADRAAEIIAMLKKGADDIEVCSRIDGCEKSAMAAALAAPLPTLP